jgi:hypothetical protein
VGQAGGGPTHGRCRTAGHRHPSVAPQRGVSDCLEREQRPSARDL